jgi:hypothetical protein
MSRRKRRTSIGGQWSARRKDMLESPAYRALSLSAHRIIDRVCLEHMYQGGAENARLIVTYDDFERYGIHRHAIAPAIREAIALGFLEITKQGRAGNAEWRSAHQYRITFHASDETVGDGSHEWKKVTEEQAPILAATARKNKSPVAENANFQCGNRHRKRQSHSTESATTVHGTDSATTFYISSGEDAA